MRLHFTVTFAATVLATSVAPAQQLTTTERARIDSVARAVLAGTGAPSASIAIVRSGQIVYEQGYGNGRLDPRTPANPAMRYAIGSVSKQFTATAMLLLAEEGKLSLDDHVSKWLPQLTRADEVTIRQLLSMTAGYQDYWPQDYVFTDMQRPTTADAIMQRWAGNGKPLDFEPGSKWQYSNTNYVIAGAIIEKATGMPLVDFLRQRIFAPLHMTSVADFNAAPLTANDAAPYLRNALGPLRPAPKEAPGWLFAAGELSMTAHDLALWDLSVINRSILRAESYRAQQTDMLLNSGLPTRYGLGVSVGSFNGHRRISHNGAVSGYTTDNEIFPEDSAAIVVFTNIYPGAAGAPSQIAARIGNILFAGAVTQASQSARDQARRIYEGLMNGTIDRSLFTMDANAYFTQQVIADYAASLKPLGAPTEFTAQGDALRGGMTIRSYRIVAGGVVMDLTTMTRPDGKIDQYIVARAG
ncbi:MAG TPA: serine hydrolase domain-containing protein [Gemmatimonadaceae bacterium]|nr:serine hydrolase domain-containing protein [Gemmatimonadaceae bacterium]